MRYQPAALSRQSDLVRMSKEFETPEEQGSKTAYAIMNRRGRAQSRYARTPPPAIKPLKLK